MKKEIKQIPFTNQTNPNSFLDVVRIEEFMTREMDHDIGINHQVNFFVMMFIIEGKGIHTIDFTDYTYDQGSVLLVRKDQIHKFRREASTKGYLVVFTEDFILSHLNKIQASKAMQMFNDALNFPKIQFQTEEDFADFLILIRHLEEEYNTKDAFSKDITRSALHIAITKLFRVKSKYDTYVYQKKYITHFLTFQKLVERDCFKSKKVNYYASEMGISAKTLNNIVRNIINESAKKFIDDISIMQIKRLLISADHSIKEIAYMSGFSDSSNFFKYFKKYTDTTPELFRQSH